MLFKRKSTKEYNVNLYDSIDELPIKIWFEIHKTGDYSLLIKGKLKINDYIIDKCDKKWAELYNQYIDKFGLSEEFLVDLDSQIELAQQKAEYIINGDRYLKTLIKIGEEKLKESRTGEVKPVELEILLAKMSKYYGFKLESKELTVTQYYSYLKIINNG